MTEYIILKIILLAIIIISTPLLVVCCIRDYIRAGKPIKTDREARIADMKGQFDRLRLNLATLYRIVREKTTITDTKR